MDANEIQNQIMFLVRLQKAVETNKNGGAVVWQSDAKMINDIERSLRHLKDTLKPQRHGR
ncbi:MAG: hypothetical protein ACK5DD_10280 [Cyclobacteriaceae bacterium]|jgi:hypothetical protein